MNQKLYANTGVRIAGVVFLIALAAILIFLLTARGGEAEEPPIPGPTATAVPNPTETPAFTPAVVSTAAATAVAARATITAVAKNPRVTVPPFTLQPEESKNITVAPENASELRLFMFESAAPIKLEITLGDELIFLSTCEIRGAPGEPSRPFTSLDYTQALKVSQARPAVFTFTNSCGNVALQVDASYTLAQ